MPEACQFRTPVETMQAMLWCLLPAEGYVCSAAGMQLPFARLYSWYAQFQPRNKVNSAGMVSAVTCIQCKLAGRQAVECKQLESRLAKCYNSMGPMIHQG